FTATPGPAAPPTVASKPTPAPAATKPAAPSSPKTSDLKTAATQPGRAGSQLRRAPAKSGGMGVVSIALGVLAFLGVVGGRATVVALGRGKTGFSPAPKETQLAEANSLTQPEPGQREVPPTSKEDGTQPTTPADKTDLVPSGDEPKTKPAPTHEP